MWKKSFIVISLIITIVFLIKIIYITNNKLIYNSDINNDAVNNPFIGYLVIEKINLKLGFYDIDNPKNNVDYNIEILKESKEGRLFIAGHSGVGKVSFFNDLIFLKKKDILKIIYQNKEYIYKITDIYKENKKGKIHVSQKTNEKILILTTCDQIEKGKQLVIKAVLEE